MAGRSVNKVVLLGNLGKDAETKFTAAGVARTMLVIATSRRYKDQQSEEWKEQTQWHTCVLWRSETVATYLTKGKQVYVEGRLETRSWEDKEGQKRYATEVVVEELILLGGAEGRTEEERLVSAPAKTPKKPQPATDPMFISDDDVPF